jgi:hypothetical protein
MNQKMRRRKAIIKMISALWIIEKGKFIKSIRVNNIIS